MPKEHTGKDETLLRMHVAEVGYADRYGLQGVVVLSSEDGRRFPITAFSGEVADHVERFRKGDRTSIPTIYKMVEELAERQSLFLERVEIYQRSKVLRANLFFRGKSASVELRNYRASDSIALATYYDAEIKMNKGLLDQSAVSP